MYSPTDFFFFMQTQCESLFTVWCLFLSRPSYSLTPTKLAREYLWKPHSILYPAVKLNLVQLERLESFIKCYNMFNIMFAIALLCHLVVKQKYTEKDGTDCSHAAMSETQVKHKCPILLPTAI